MIIDYINNYRTYLSLHPNFSSGFDFINSFNPNNFKEGKNEILGDDVFALVFNLDKYNINTNLEAHNNYIDIQYLVEGTDKMGWKNRALCKVKNSEYNSEKDVILYKDIPENIFNVRKNHFVIFFPNDAHSPLMKNTPCLKIVVKIKLT